jgi:gas vesicle protein
MRRVARTWNPIPETILPLVTGVGVGAVTGLLLAPKSCEELQGNLADGVSDRFNQVLATGKDLKRRAQKVLDLARD